MTRLLAVVFALLATEIHAAVVVEDANLSWGPGSISNPHPGVPDANYAATIFQDAGATDHTSAWFYYDGASIRGINANLDEGSDWYIVSSGQALTSQVIQQGLVAPLITYGPELHPPVAVDPGQDIYLGVVSGHGIGPDDRDVNDIFGWVLLRSTVGNPQSSPPR